MPKKKKSKNKKGPTKPKKRGGKGQVLHDLREFKKKLHGWVDRTKILWTGDPWQEGSNYSFVLDEELVSMVIGLVQRTQLTEQRHKAEELAQERNESLKQLLKQTKGPGVALEETPQDTEAAGTAEEEKTQEEKEG